MRLADGDGGSARALADAVEAVNRLEPGPQAVIVSGDLVNDPGPGKYERLRELLAPLHVAVYVLPGNHDDPAALHEHFPLAGAGAGEDYRYAADVGELRLIACDTTVAGTGAGALGAERRAWLAAELDAEPERPTVVAMHHPPIAFGIDALDVIGLPAADQAGLSELLSSHPQVRRVICGHVHRAAFGALGNCGVVCCPSGYLAAPLEIEVGGTEADLVPEPPAFAVHALLGSGGLVSHVQPILVTSAAGPMEVDAK